MSLLPWLARGGLLLIGLSWLGTALDVARKRRAATWRLGPDSAGADPQIPVSVVIPPKQKARITVEWTERWAEGVINEGTEGNGDRLGTFEVFLGYIEPCSLINQENVE